MALLIMWSCLHLSLFGLFERWTKKQREKFSIIGVMVISAALTMVTASALPDAAAARGKFWWLGLAVGGGAAVHCLGDAITRAGVPFLWAVPFRWRCWWEIQLPPMLAFRAGGRFEYAALFPVLTVLTLWLVAYTLPASKGLAVTAAGLIGVHVPS